MRRYGYDQPYERLKQLTRGVAVTEGDVATFVRGLDLPAEVEARLLKLTPATYTGLAAELVGWLDR
jgi:adenylosuccinate lyase